MAGYCVINRHSVNEYLVESDVVAVSSIDAAAGMGDVRAAGTSAVGAASTGAGMNAVGAAGTSAVLVLCCAGNCAVSAAVADTGSTPATFIAFDCIEIIVCANTGVGTRNVFCISINIVVSS